MGRGVELRILVTGGLGFIGSNFIQYMLVKHRNVEIVNVDKMSYGANPANLKSYETNPRYTFYRGDIAEKAPTRKLVRDVDVVVNFAAESHVDRSIVDPWPFVHSNIIGVLTILEAIRQADNHARLLQVSTDEVYGEVREGSANEHAPLAPSSPYAASKASADMLVGAHHRTYGTDVVITRCTNNFGPYQFPEKLIPKTVIRARNNLVVPMYGSGSAVRDWIYVADHCEALDVVIANGKSGEIYNIAGHNELENLEIVRRILEISNRPQRLVRHVEDRPGHDARYSLDDAKIRKKLGWRPRHRFEEALKQTVEWYVGNEEWWRPIATKKLLDPTPWKLRW